jgi:hypothetical protein
VTLCQCNFPAGMTTIPPGSTRCSSSKMATVTYYIIVEAILVPRGMILTSDLRDGDYELIKATKKRSSNCSCL